MIDEWRVSKICPEYEVSTQGTVRNIKTKKIVYPSFKGSSLYVSLKDKGKTRSYKLCDVVADAFDNGLIEHSDMKVKYKNNNRQDNRPGNLIYVPIKKAVQKKRDISYRDDKILCVETGKVYYNAYEVKEELGIALRDVAYSVVHKQVMVKANDGEYYHFEIVN